VKKIVKEINNIRNTVSGTCRKGCPNRTQTSFSDRSSGGDDVAPLVVKLLNVKVK